MLTTEAEELPVVFEVPLVTSDTETVVVFVVVVVVVVVTVVAEVVTGLSGFE